MLVHFGLSLIPVSETVSGSGLKNLIKSRLTPLLPFIKAANSELHGIRKASTGTTTWLRCSVPPSGGLIGRVKDSSGTYYIDFSSAYFEQPDMNSDLEAYVHHAATIKVGFNTDFPVPRSRRKLKLG